MIVFAMNKTTKNTFSDPVINKKGKIETSDIFIGKGELENYDWHKLNLLFDDLKRQYSMVLSILYSS